MSHPTLSDPSTPKGPYPIGRVIIKCGDDYCGVVIYRAPYWVVVQPRVEYIDGHATEHTRILPESRVRLVTLHRAEDLDQYMRDAVGPANEIREIHWPTFGRVQSTLASLGWA